jgi:hypothetical protein
MPKAFIPSSGKIISPTKVKELRPERRGDLPGIVA